MGYLKKIKFQLRTNDFNSLDYLTYSSLLDIFQTASSIHSNELNVSFTKMQELGLCWVLPRIRVSFLESPKQDEVLTVKTYVSPSLNPYEYRRDFLVYNKARLLIAYATSIWVLIDMNSRKLVKKDLYKNTSRYKPSIHDISKLHVDFSASYTKCSDYIVRSVDIDHNKHLNNSIYPHICSLVSNIDLSVYKNMYIDYLLDIKENDILSIYYFKDEDKLTFIIFKGEKKACILEFF